MKIFHRMGNMHISYNPQDDWEFNATMGTTRYVIDAPPPSPPADVPMEDAIPHPPPQHANHQIAQPPMQLEMDDDSPELYYAPDMGNGWLSSSSSSSSKHFEIGRLKNRKWLDNENWLWYRKLVNEELAESSLKGRDEEAKSKGYFPKPIPKIKPIPKPIPIIKPIPKLIPVVKPIPIPVYKPITKPSFYRRKAFHSCRCLRHDANMRRHHLPNLLYPSQPLQYRSIRVIFAWIPSPLQYRRISAISTQPQYCNLGSLRRTCSFDFTITLTVICELLP
ncbi:hypothetical protein E2542_SST04336 [Spatholobus suberectus]|nr:hypothetical protein E2542_SST04336 [Spatholobus suberectus]